MILRAPFVPALTAMCAAFALRALPAGAATPAPLPSPRATGLPAGLAQLLGASQGYGAFTKDAVKQDGLFTLWRKDGKVYLEIRDDQFNKDFLLHIVNANGLGGFGVYPGQLQQQEARLVRFERDGKRISLIWKQATFVADPGTPLADAVRESQTDSTVGILSPAAEDKEKKLTILDVSLLLGDILDLGSSLSDPNPLGGQAYRVDPSRSYFGPSKAFPKNVIIEADQTFASARETEVNTVPDSRSLLMRIKYQFIALPDAGAYMPRFADDRVGYFEDPHIEFGHDDRRDNILHYMLRWNVQPSNPASPHSPAKEPIVFTLSNTIPTEYRGAMRAAVLEWNKAFERIGITGALEVKDQPSDPSFDPDDARYNMIRWVTNAYPGFGAQAEFIWDPRSGQMLQGGVLVDSSITRFESFNHSVLDLDARSVSTAANRIDIDTALPKPAASSAIEAEYGRGKAAEAAFGALALGFGDNPPPGYINAFVKDVVMHEIGHTLGLSHNFIGHAAYSIAQVESRSFTRTNAVVSSVMEYNPINVSPKGKPQGTYFNETIGPYDYHAVAWGYGRVFNARTPADEVPTLDRWAGVYNDPRYTFHGDEDAFWSGHAVDPRVEPFMLTNDPIGWCGGQLQLNESLLKSTGARFSRPQQPWDDRRTALIVLLNQYIRCTNPMSHYIAAEYLSRARVGDVRAGTPLSPYPREQSRRAFELMNRYLFSAGAFRWPPETLRSSVYTERIPVSDFGYEPALRHDIPIVGVAALLQNAALRYMFSPFVLQRLADLPTKSSPGQTMTLTDLFTWTQNAVYGDLASPSANGSEIHRNLQRRYAKLLIFMTNQPVALYPYDAQALARYELNDLAGKVRTALAKPQGDVLARAHLQAMQVDVTRALEAKTTL